MPLIIYWPSFSWRKSGASVFFQLPDMVSSSKLHWGYLLLNEIDIGEMVTFSTCSNDFVWIWFLVCKIQILVMWRKWWRHLPSPLVKSYHWSVKVSTSYRICKLRFLGWCTPPPPSYVKRARRTSEGLSQYQNFFLGKRKIVTNELAVSFRQIAQKVQYNDHDMEYHLLLLILLVFMLIKFSKMLVWRLVILLKCFTG